MYNEATNEFNKLLERNPENNDYYCKLHDAEKLKTDHEKFEMACRYRIKFPRALMPRRMALNYVTGNAMLVYMIHSFICFYQKLLKPVVRKCVDVWRL